MKKITILLLLISFCSVRSIGQQVNITTFKVKSTLPADITSWAKDPGSILLLANKVPFQKIDAAKLVIQVKSNGAVICGYPPEELKARDSSFALKAFSATDLAGMLPKCDNLKPGTYQLCAQFFNADNKAISKESYKDFTVEGSVIPPSQETRIQLLSPADGAVLTAEEAKKDINFRWTPLLPAPKEDIIYKVSLIEVRKGQTANEAMRSGKVLIEKEVTNQTELSCCVNPIIVWPIAASSTYGWFVRATSGKGIVLGTSNAGIFNPDNGSSTNPPAMMMAGANADFVLVDIACTGTNGNQKIYHIKARYKNLASSTNSILINDAQVLPATVFPGNPGGSGLNLMSNIRQKSGTYNAALTMNNILEVNTGTISGFVPFPATFTPSLSPGTDQYFEFDYTTSAASATFTFYGLVDDSKKLMANRNTRNEELTISQFPDCPCSYCREDMLQIAGPSITDNNNILTFSTVVSIPGIQIKQFKAELISFYHRPVNGNEQCYTCNKNSTTFGNFVSGTLTNTGWNVINGVFPADPSNNNTHHTLGWWNNAPVAVPFTNKPLTLNISLPPASTLTCCEDNFRFCIRYSFTDSECRTCSFVRCYPYVRKPKPVIFNPNQADLSADGQQNQ